MTYFLTLNDIECGSVLFTSVHHGERNFHGVGEHVATLLHWIYPAVGELTTNGAVLLSSHVQH